MRKHTCQLLIIFAEWGYLGKGKFQRRDFRPHATTSPFLAVPELALSFKTAKSMEIFKPRQDLPADDGG